ncbi:ABC transporter permease [Arenimonas caeni]|uniref:ABC transporter permease n=1 Tax=Arenimonas caeni TaxID=2058085 RepID=A0A2P6MBF3_9GAMM|nr:FtsX-like permease family protein [Arenimonas caeni]MDY0022432.1 ABC transporter permease [Arenimonas caeni]PRH83315.1 ABC transporter permease [Arenimonas caeni]
MKALDRKLWRELRQLRGQTIAIALVLVAGIATVVMSLTAYRALHDTRERFYAGYRFADVFAPVVRAPWPLLEELRGLEGVQAAEGRVLANVNLEIEGFDDAANGLIVSLPDPGQGGLNALFLRAGRLPDPLRANEVVLGEAFAEAHGLRPGDSLAAIINGRRQVLQVAGIGLSPEFVYQIRPGDAFPDYRRYGVLWMQREPLAAALDLDGAFNDVVLALRRGAREADVIDALDALLAPYGGLGAHGRELQTSHRFLDEELVQLRVMVRMFSTVFLAVAAFLLNIVIGRLVNTQREQIAVLKAFGYSRWEVGRHYAALVGLMVGAGLVPGVLVGAWLGRGMADLYADFFRFPSLDWSLDAGVLALAVAFAAAVAALGTATGLHRAFALSPAEGMRPEAPPVFRRGRLEGPLVQHLVDPAARMVLRTLVRRPLRTSLTVFGIGLACGILLMSRFSETAIDQMIELQLGFAQRDDLAVTFVEPRPARAALELAALPGVAAVEPFRQAPVVLRNGHREHRLAVLGLPARGDLRRLLGPSLAPLPLPADGLVLTDYLAGMLALQPGDAVEMEFLDGRRETVSLTVRSLSHEYLGVGAYLELSALQRLRGEQDSLSGAWLRLEPGAREQVIRALRARPGVAAATDRAAMIEGFRDTMAEVVLTFTLIATAMAAAIAIGVVYNSARISLSERSRELASLRVLGYTRAEVRALVSGELFTLAGLALLPGFALGYALCGLLVWGFESELYRIPLALSPAGLGTAGLVVLAATAASVLAVRRRVDGLDLIAVLKTKD